MPLISSKTSLNKIKWGNDRYDSGNSGQPYIKSDIPGVNVNDPNPTIVNDDSNPPPIGGLDFLWRGGLNAPIDAARDVSRLTQMMFDLKSPNGFEFIAKQNLLSRTAVKTEASYGVGYGGGSQPDFIKGTGGGAVNAGIYTPLSTFAQAAVGFTGTHLNLLGLDPSDPMANIGDGGGLFPGAGLTTYTAAMNKNNNFADYSTKEQNFEEKVYNSPAIPNTLILGSEQSSEPEFILKTVTKQVSTSEDGFNNRLVELYNKKIEITFDKPELIEYTGGPGSILGIGSTTINFADQRTGINNATATNDPSYFLGGDYGKDRYLITSPSIYKNFQTKLNATFQAKMAFPNEKESLEGFTDDATLQNINAQPSTIDNAYLTNIGFNNPEGPNFFNVFKNFGEAQTSSSISYETNLTKVLQSSQVLTSINDEELAELTDVNAIQNNNTPQSTFKNYKLEEASFFNPDGPNNFDTFKNFGEAQTSSSISYETNLTKVLQSSKASVSINDEELEVLTDVNSIQNNNTPQSTFKNYKLEEANFFNPDGPNNFDTFKNFGEAQSSSSISYDANLTKILQSSQASVSINDETLEVLTDVNAIQNNNTPQSTFKNYKLEEANFFDPDGPNNFDVFKNFGEAQSSSSISYESGLTKILQSSQASSSISDAELAELTDISNIQNNNTPQSTFKNYKLEEANFFNPTSKYNNFDVFRNFGDTDSQGIQFLDEVGNAINKFILGASNAFSIDPGAANFKTGQEVSEANDISQIEANNTPQSTFKNFKLQEKGFFNPDGPNFYNVFLPQSNLPVKENIFVEGSSVSYAYINAFPETEGNMFDQFSPLGGGGFRLYNNNVYDFNIKTDPTGPAYYNQTQTMTQAQLVGQTAGQGIRDFRVPIIEAGEITESSVLSLAPSYPLKNATNRINRGDPGRVNTRNNTKNVFNYGLPATEGYALDKLTAMPMYDGQGPDTSLAINDFVKFRIAAINNEPDADGSAVYMHFRAFIDGFSDTYNASWDPVKYSGRGEDLYNYTGFNRSINMSFTCFAQSKPELIPMYKKLNYLASTLAPDYTNAGFMRGNLVRLTMGGYLYEQPGFITSLTYDIPQETPWEIAINAAGGQDSSVKELPHMIKVSSLQFTPIHNFLPQKANDPRNPNERFISLSNNSGHGNYNDSYQMQLATGDGDNNNQNNILGE